MRRWVLFAMCVLAAPAGALEVTWTPQNPGREEPVRIVVSGVEQGGVIHWGVNAEDKDWEPANPAYRPAGSQMDGVATRTPLRRGPDGAFSATLGPFDREEQVVRTLDFVIQWEDGGWANNAGNDYSIRIGKPRIVMTPEHPSITDVVDIVVRRSRPGGILRWGVNEIEEEWHVPHTRYWPDGTAPVGDGLAVETPLPDPGPDGKSRLRMGPFDSAAQLIHSLHFAVHWGKDWDANNGDNYNFEIDHDAIPGAPRPEIVTPAEDSEIDGRFAIEVQSPGADVLTLWLDGSPRVSFLGAPFTWEMDSAALDYGPHRITLRALSADDKPALAASTFWRVPEVTKAEPPPDLELGAHPRPDGPTSFALYAPGKRFVALIGDFNDWNPTSHLMSVSSDGTWWTEVSLDPGVYEYQYLVNGHQKLADPLSRDVQWVNPEGEESTIARHARTVLDVGRPEYEWKSGDYERPDLRKLVIYEFHVDDFVPGGGFTGVTARLDYIADLGVTGIEPLPVTEFPGDESWGYNPAYYLAPESTYGTPEELKELIDVSHGFGMAFVKDIVLNHTDYAAPLCALYGRDYETNPYYRVFDGPNWGFPDLDQKSEAFKQHVADALQFWIRDYRVDGYRYDATRWTGWSGYNDWGAGWFAYAAKQADAGTYQIAEHIPAEPVMIQETELDAEWGAHFRWRLREMLTRADVPNAGDLHDLIDPTGRGYTSGFQRVVYTESHDEERFMRELLEAGYTEEQARHRIVTGLAFTLTVPGIPMLYSGQEFGERTKKFVGPNPLQWELLNTPVGRSLHRDTRALVHLRVENPALISDQTRVLHNDARTDTVVYERGDGEDRVLVAANLSDQPRRVSLRPSVRGPWRNVLTEETRVDQAQGGFSISLEAGQSAVFERE